MEKVRWWIPAANKAFNLCIELKSTFAALALDISFINNYCNHHITRPCRQISTLRHCTGRGTGQRPLHSVQNSKQKRNGPLHLPAGKTKNSRLDFQRGRVQTKEQTVLQTELLCILQKTILDLKAWPTMSLHALNEPRLTLRIYAPALTTDSPGTPV